MAAVMQGYRVHAWGEDPVWEDMPVPAPGAGEVLVEVEACGVGLTVLNCINGNLADDPALLPRVPGHEVAGRVVKAGTATDQSLVGRRVVAYFYLVCGECAPCARGIDPRCENLAGWVGVHRDGGYAQYTVLPARNAIPVDDELDPVAATVVPDAVATPVHVVGRAGIGAGDRVVVIGAGGGVGIHMVQVARHYGASVAGFDLGAEKLAAIERLGAIAVDSGDFAAVDAARVFAEGGPTVVVDLLGSTESTRWGIDGLAMGGRYVALTTFPDRPATFESRALVFRELSLLGSRYSHRDQVAAAARLVVSGAVEPMIGAVTGPDRVLDLHARLREGSLVGRGALDWRRESG